MAKEITITVYEFEELDPQVQEDLCMSSEGYLDEYYPQFTEEQVLRFHQQYYYTKEGAVIEMFNPMIEIQQVEQLVNLIQQVEE